MIVTGWTRIVTNIDSNEPGVENVKDKEEYYLTKTAPINYRSVVESYVMPFDFLWALLVMTEDQEFVYSVAQLALDSKIILTVQDNLITTESYEKDEYTVDNPIIKTAKAITIMDNAKKEHVIDKSKRNNKNDFKTEENVITQSCSVNVDITYADTWIAEYKNEYSNTIPDEGEGNGEENVASIPDEEFKIIEDTWKEPDKEIKDGLKELLISRCANAEDYEYRLGMGTAPTGEIVDNKMHYQEKIRTINKKITTKETITRNVYTQGTPVVTEKIEKDSEEENFVTLFVNSTGAKSKIIGAPDWLFEIMENSEKTADMVDLVKYLLYKATDRDFGVTEFDFSVFEPSSFTSISGLYGSTIEEKVWWAIIDAGFSEYAAAATLGNLAGESSMSPGSVEDTPRKDKGYGLAQWTFGRQEQLFAFAEHRGVPWYDENIQIEFLIAEISGGVGADGFADNQWMDRIKYYKDTYNADLPYAKKEYWVNAQNYADTDEKIIFIATQAFCYGFERPKYYGEERFEKNRYNPALKYYKEFHGKSRGIYVGGITNEEEAKNLQELIENEWIHTVVHKNKEMQNGPFLKYWDKDINTLTKYQCTWWAKGRASMYLEQMGITNYIYPPSGNGGDYYQYNINAGWFEYGQTPRPNSLVSWTKIVNGKKQYGHVAYVEGVTEDGIYISHAGGGEKWFGVQKIPLTGKIWYNSGYRLNGYIYLDSPKNIN